jgi:superfamily II DNA helicase RecQ
MSVPASIKDTADNGLTIMVNGLITLMEDMIDAMQQEELLILARNYKDHAALLKTKQRQTIEYRASMKSIAAQSEMLQQLPDTVRTKLKYVAQKLADVSQRNAEIMRNAVIATQKLLQSIVMIVKQEALAKPGYSDTRKASTLGAYSPICQPLTVRQTA